jgi:hypothetical protein
MFIISSIVLIAFDPTKIRRIKHTDVLQCCEYKVKPDIPKRVRKLQC